MCSGGFECSSYAPGHALHLIQYRLAAATPLEWVDGIVEHADAEAGTLIVRTLADGERITVWSGSGAAWIVTAGSPVALHARYHVLASGRQWFNVAR